MSDSPDGNLTEMLAAAAGGDLASRDQLIAAVYRQLHGLARGLMSGERAVVTLQATALVNEAFLRLFGRNVVKANDRKHFLNVAARQMRRILIDHAREHNADKRKGEKIDIEDAPGEIPVHRSPDLMALDDALVELAKVDTAAAEVVEKKYFGGYTDEETAAILKVSVARVRRDWSYARAWLHNQLSQAQEERSRTL